MGRKRQAYTPEQRAERDAIDAEHRAHARDLIADPEALERMVTTLIAAGSPRVLHYSLRNQGLLAYQAAARGMTLTDVDSLKGWRDRGRGVRRGETGLRITSYRGTDRAGEHEPDAEAPDEVPSDQEQGGEDGGKLPSRFRMTSVFDISQTEGVDPFADGFNAYVAEDPAISLRQSLTKQLEQFGYEVFTGNVAAAQVDDGPPATVTVPFGTAGVTQLAQVLGAILSRPRKERPEWRALPTSGDAACITDQTPKPGRVVLTLGDDSTITAHTRVDWNSGTVVYAVRGHRVRGSFTISSSDPIRNAEFHAARVQFGDWSGGDFFPEGEAPDLPVVNGVTVVGGNSGLTADDIPTVTRRRVGVYRTNNKYGRDAPAKTSDRTADVVRAILAHWFTRDDLSQLHTARARYIAPEHRMHAAHQAAQLDDHIRRLTADRDQAAEQAEKFAAIADQEVIQGTPY
ncbi:ArdC-like ssDNA-binding domain-containing protein [Actinokineospora enzanensis]|uniref:ArdC-like ssDNA-binding domain-containing protein n=1 Tax=Actinokineospora enzanensis TaxID=155975 RepID=UPI00039E3A08|nr:ArdC-like ssDNA-binding domain-containing protein [Actinokineospora enzanensis]